MPLALLPASARTSLQLFALVLCIVFAPSVGYAHRDLPLEAGCAVSLRNPVDFVAALLRRFGLWPDAGHKQDAQPRLPTFADVGGYQEVKAALRDVLCAFDPPQRLAKLNVTPPHGVLLVGPPGTGKTLMARALAGEADVNFVSIDGPSFIDKYAGVGQDKLRQVFRYARSIAPVILFIDEIDTIGARRGADASGVTRNADHLLNQLLVELDGFSKRPGVVVIGATNRPDVLDPALLRSGRLERKVYMGLPDAQARDKILSLKLNDIDVADDVDFEALTEMTEGLSGADIANWVNIAAMHALRDERDHLHASDFERGSSELLFGVHEAQHIDDDQRLRTCIHEAGHALVGMLSPEPRRLVRILVDPRGGVSGFTQWADSGADKLSRIHQRSKLASLLGGLAAEQLLLGDFGGGVSSDLEMATQLAETLVTIEGMGEHAGLLSLAGRHASQWRTEAAQATYQDIRALIEAARADAYALLRAHRPLLEEVSQRLLDEQRLAGADVRALIERYNDNVRDDGALAADGPYNARP